MVTFGQRIKELRTEKGYSQEELARDLSVSKNTISVWERDVRKPSFETLDYLCEYFDVSMGYLLGSSTERVRTIPDDEELAAQADAEERESLTEYFKRFAKLSPETQEIVKQTILAAYRADEARGVLQNPEWFGE